MLFISAPTLRLLEAAELQDIKKKDREGYLRELALKELDIFLYDGNIILSRHDYKLVKN